MTPTATPQDRIDELDVIRGFALFGVMWMNIFDIGGFIVPEDMVPGLTAFPVLEKVVGFASGLFMHGKAQALFSMLFGFGFAVMMDRIEARGGRGTVVYLRRLTILLAVGVAHLALLWLGDILHAYALMGFLLLLTRRWSAPWLLVTGLVFAWGVPTLVWVYFQLTSPGAPPPFAAQFDAAAAARAPWILNGGSYPAFVVDNLRSTVALYSNPWGAAFLAWILGRFLIGSWIHRQGWLQDPQRHLAGFAVAAATLIPLGLLLQLLRPIMNTLDLQALPGFQVSMRGLSPMTAVILALGYAALIVVLCRIPRMRRLLSGLGALGRMALTNYLTQSLVYFFVLYGFGLGLLPWMGPTLTLALTVVVVGLQIAFSRWWLARHAYGPVEWLWRWGTYGVKPAWRRG